MIIKNENRYQIIQEINEVDYLLIYPIYTDAYYHIFNNNLSILIIYNIKYDNEYVLIFNHYDKLSDDINTSEFLQILMNKKLYIYDKKGVPKELFQFFTNIYDINLILNLQNDEIFLPKKNNAIYKLYNSIDVKVINQNYIIPVEKHLDLFNDYKNHFKLNIDKLTNDNLNNEYYKFYNQLAVFCFRTIEKAGIQIDLKLFKQYFPTKFRFHIHKSNLIHCNYNFYTSTGRPSNTYNGINFAALNKNDNSRECIISRFTNGNLVEFDYSGYHPALISLMIKDNTNIYEYLGKILYQKDILTEEEHKEIKHIVFQQLYGNISNEFLEIEYFNKTNNLINSLWKEYKKNGYITSLISKRICKFEDIENKNKLWNYILQLYETEVNIKTIYKVIKFLKNYQTKLILYTYDSFLFDMHPDENVIEDIKNILEQNRFSVSVSCGKNYNNMKKISCFDVFLDN